MITPDVTAFDRLGAFIVALDPAGIILHWNRACSELTGRALDEIRGAPLWSLAPSPGEAARVQDFLRALRADRRTGTFETAWPSAIGEPRTLAFSSAAELDPDGRVARFVLTGVDVTANIGARDAAVEQLRALLEQAPDGIFISNLDGRFTDVNAAGCRLLGYSRDELVGSDMTVLVAPEDTERLWRHRDHLLTGTTEVLEWKVRRKDGSWVLVEVSGKILPDGRWQGLVRDISDRAQLQRALRDSHAELSRAQSVASIGSWRLNVQRNELVWSDETHRIFGIPLGTPMTYESFLARVHPDDRVQVHEQWLAALRGRPYDVEHRIVVDGRVKWVHEKADLDFDEAGRLRGGVGVVHDITAQKAAAAERELWQERMAAIVSIASDAIISIDDHHDIVVFNQGAENVFGWSAAEVLGKPVDILIPQRFHEVHGRHLMGFRGGSSTARKMGDRRVTLGVRKDGEEFQAEAAVSRVEVAGQRFFTVILRDITERTRREDEQRILAEFGAALMTTVPDYEATLAELARLAVRELADWCLIDVVVGGKLRRLKVTASDPAAAPLAAELEGTELDRSRRYLTFDAIEGGRSTLVSEVSPALLESVAQGSQHRELLRGLEMKSFLVVPLLARGRRLGAVALVSSRRRYGERDLRFAEELARVAAVAVDNAQLHQAMRRAIRARDEVLGIVAHDLRNPLNAIVMQSELLRRRGDPERRSSKPVEAIQHAALRMKRLIQDMLDVARLEAGPLAIKRATVAARRLLDEVHESHAAAASTARIRLREEVTRSLPDVLVDHGRLLQVFDNLIGNALKFTAAGGEVVVGAAPGGGEVQFWVADTGRGIPAADLPHVFDPFWQADKADQRGAGLGLPITRGIVEAHGGRIWVESQVGRGTTFHFTVPVAPRATEAATPADVPA